ncbi:chromosome 3 open reading frame 58 [Nesidiocoris tenuis]|uniref:Chromosome 3 open reading frame 58 n=1 Tax=Nesidiocoris tenuis TaxID=355587 RepID=A0ABN7B6K4_9HEMI|nr:chromosome 3 open reading frame 58 [Nesidiocoris tenuis]
MDRWPIKTLFTGCTVVVSIVYYALNDIDLRSLCDYESKPVIYGDGQCENIFNDRITVKNPGILNTLMTYLSPKAVIKGTLDNRGVCLKRLSTENEAEFADLLFFSIFRNVELTDMAIPLVKIEILKNIINHEPTPQFYNGVQKLIFCPKLNKIDQLLVHVPDFDFGNVLKYVEVWTSVLLNAEPLILQILQPPSWPVPVFYGSCGRMIVVEDCGTILTDFKNNPWEERAHLSVQLLQAAFNFTFNHPDLAFYFTDTSPDNIAVDERRNVRFIDLEHVIIVEKNPILDEQPPDWNMNHSSTYIPCVDCYSFSPEEICSHRASDYNVLAVCREILHNTSLLFPNGFLHSIPDSLPAVQASLPSLLSRCVENDALSDRFSVASDIMRILTGSIT